MACDCYPHEPDEPCTAPHAKVGCTCDINWDCTSYDPCEERAVNELSRLGQELGI